MLSYLVTIISPWKLLSGIFAAFPAVMLTAVFMMGISSGSKKAAKIAQGSVYGMIGGVVCVATVLAVLKASNNWVLSIFAGLLLWLISSIFISTLREQIKNFSIKEKAGTN